MLLISRIEELEKIVSQMSLTGDYFVPVIEINEEPVLGKVKKLSKSRSTNKDGSDRKKRGASGFNLFMRDASEDAREVLLEAAEDGKMKRGELVAEVSRMWKELTDDERNTYNERAKNELEKSYGSEDD